MTVINSTTRQKMFLSIDQSPVFPYPKIHRTSLALIMWFSSRTPYRKAQSGDAAMDEDKRELLDEHELPNDEHHCVCGRRAKLSANQWLVHIALTCLSASVGFIFVALTHSSNYDSAMSDKECAKQVSSFSRLTAISNPTLLTTL